MILEFVLICEASLSNLENSYICKKEQASEELLLKIEKDHIKNVINSKCIPFSLKLIIRGYSLVN